MIKLEIDKILLRLRKKLPETWRKYEERLGIESRRLDPIPAHQSMCYGIEGIKNSNTIVLHNSKICLPSPDSKKDIWMKWKDRDSLFKEFKELELEFINLFYNEYKYRFCPYCGKIPLIGYENNEGEQKRTFDLDHFYLKNTYRHLMYNFYNLVPVCKICNLLKTTRDFNKEEEYYHPYFGWVKNREIDESKNQNTEFCFSEDEKGTIKFNAAQKLYKLDSIYLNAQDTKNDIEFIRTQLERIADTKKKLPNVGDIMNNYFQHFAPMSDKEILQYTNGKLRLDMINSVKKQLFK